MAKKGKRGSAPRKYKIHEDHNFVLIAGGGFIVLVLMYMVTGGDFFIGNSYRSGTQANASHVVEKKVIIENDSFVPETLTINKGTTVTWINNDTTGHTISGDDGSFDSGNLQQNESGSVTFDRAGTFEYHDQFNPQLSGTIIVE